MKIEELEMLCAEAKRAKDELLGHPMSGIAQDQRNRIIQKADDEAIASLPALLAVAKAAKAERDADRHLIETVRDKRSDNHDENRARREHNDSLVALHMAVDSLEGGA